MHIDWDAIRAFIVWMFPFFKNSLDVMKAGVDIANEAKSLVPFIYRKDGELKRPDEEDLDPDWAVERVRASADVLRSLALLGLVEWAFRTAQMVVMAFLLSRFMDYAQKSKSRGTQDAI